jgi:anti-anti-sigma factor
MAEAPGCADGTRPRVLLVDDVHINLLALSAVLAPLNLDIVTATSGEEALMALMDDGAGPFSLIVLDVMMPGLDGFETARLIKLRDRTRQVPIIFLTAAGTSDHHREAYASGAVDFLSKPFNPEILRAKVCALVELTVTRQRLELEVAERTASERRLAEREHQLAKAESLARVGAWRWDPASGEVVWSDELFRIFGREPHWSPVGPEAYLAHVHPDERDRVAVAVERTRATGEAFLIEHRALRADGSLAWIRGQARRHDATGVVFGAAQDVTERRRAEEQFTQFFNLSLDLMAVSGLDGRLQRVNPSFARLLGWSDEELLALPPEGLVHPGDVDKVVAALAALQAEGGEIAELELRLRCRDGRYRWFRMSARAVPGDGVVYVVGIDITERKQAALLLAESEERYRLLVDHAPEAIVVFEAGSGRFVDANPEAERLVGLPRERLVGLTVADLGAGAERWMQRVMAADTEPFEWAVHRPAGGEVLCEVRLLALPGSGRKLARGSLIDITERRRAEEAQAEAAERERALRQSQEIAQALQRSLLPEELPEVPGLGLAARYLPGSSGLDVGGDWYDVIPTSSGAVALVIGDVVGRGLGAAATMGQLRTALRAYALEEQSPGRVIERLDGLAKWLPAAAMTTLVYAVYEPESGVLTYACAGHPPPLVVIPASPGDPDRQAYFLEEGRGAPLGVHGAGISEGAAVLEPESVLVLYTDGLIERPGMSIDEGMDQLAEVARGAAGGGPEAVCQALVGGAASSDDVAVLVVSLASVSSGRFHLRLAAEPERLATLRRSLTRWLTQAGATAEECHGLVLASSEAVTNAVIHAYGTGDGVVEVEATLQPAGSLSEPESLGAWVDGDGVAGPVVTVTVRDAGRWRLLDTPGGGRGFLLMQSLVHECQVKAGLAGTAVVLRRQLGRAVAPPGEAVVIPELPLAGAGPQTAEVVGVVRLDEELDASNAAAAGAVLAGAVRPEHWGLVVDASAVHYLDSSALRMLVDLKWRLEQHRQLLWVVVPPDSPVRRVLGLTGIDRIVPVAATVEEAAARLQAQHGGARWGPGACPDEAAAPSPVR